MLKINKLIAQGRGLAKVLVQRASTLALDWQQRQQSLLRIVDAQGQVVVIDLPQGLTMQVGDVLVGEDGSLTQLVAAAQPVMRVSHCAEHGHPSDLLRSAYHLGVAHVRLAIAADHLLLLRDESLAKLLAADHLIVQPADAPFDPEPGALDGRAATHAAPAGAQDAHAGHGHDHHGHDPAHRH